ncbi:MAG: hypothetical protein O7D34_09010 [Ignavibacteria bacterium]|nr:hypothetical protein [Ignavibacteria bacterium]
MNKHKSVVLLSFILLFASVNNISAQESIEECVQWEGELPCNLLTYQTLVDPATLPIAPVAVAMHIVRYDDDSATWNGTDESIASGVYFARFTVTSAVGEQKYAKINKLVLMK